MFLICWFLNNRPTGAATGGGGVGLGWPLGRGTAQSRCPRLSTEINKENSMHNEILGRDSVFLWITVLVFQGMNFTIQPFPFNQSFVFILFPITFGHDAKCAHAASSTLHNAKLLQEKHMWCNENRVLGLRDWKSLTIICIIRGGGAKNSPLHFCHTEHLLMQSGIFSLLSFQKLTWNEQWRFRRSLGFN